MTIKITAITASVCAVLLYVLATIFPNDPYFYVISSNPAVIIGRLVLAALLVWLAFRHKFKTAYGHRIAAGTGLAMVFFGIAGIIIPPMTYSLFSLFKPMDYMFFIESGIILNLAALTYQRGTERFPRISRPRNTQLRLFTPQHNA